MVNIVFYLLLHRRQLSRRWASQVVLVVQKSPANAGKCKGHGIDPWVRKIPGGGHGNPLQYSSLENAKDRGAW